MARTGRRYHVPPHGKLSDVNNELAKIDRDIRGKSWLKADLPTDGSLLIATVSDESGGATVAFWDGTDWRRVQDRAVVS
jgi:hypothetical protein